MLVLEKLDNRRMEICPQRLKQINGTKRQPQIVVVPIQVGNNPPIKLGLQRRSKPNQ